MVLALGRKEKDSCRGWGAAAEEELASSPQLLTTGPSPTTPATRLSSTTSHRHAASTSRRRSSPTLRHTCVLPHSPSVLASPDGLRTSDWVWS